MPLAEPIKTFLMEAGGECDEIKITHSNPLQEVKSYNLEKKYPEESLPFKFWLLNYGGAIQKGDPVVIHYRISNKQRLVTEGDNPDSNWEGQFGSAYLLPAFPAYDDSVYWTTWPFQYQIVKFDNNRRELQIKEQLAQYNPGLTDQQIKEGEQFKTYYASDVTERNLPWTETGQPPPPMELYEIENIENRILFKLRQEYEKQWPDEWLGIAASSFYQFEGELWTGRRNSSGQPTYESYSLDFTEELDLLGLFTPDGVEIEGEGLNPITLIVKEFFPGGSAEPENDDDWAEVLRINFMGTPAPLKVECDECAEDCLPVYKNVATKICVCKDKKPNETDDIDYQPYHQNQTPIRVIDFNP